MPVFFSFQNSDAVVKLPPRISALGIEEILKECYHKTGQKKFSCVLFDFSVVTWSDVFSISIFSLWIWELIEKKKKVTLILPTCEEVLSFFQDYDFIQFLINNKVTLVGKTEATSARTQERNFAPFYPLTFVSTTKFQALYEGLKNENRLETVLAQVKATDVVKSGAIRDVILKELGDNMFIHGEGKAAHLVMTKVSKLFPHKKCLPHRTPTLADSERAFLEKLGEQPVLEVVISDKGPGIFSKLKNAYISDLHPDVPPTECQVIDYAFSYHSSSRSLEERIGEIQKVLTFESQKLPPPTGLHRLKETVRENNGFLLVRSGASIVCYDFLFNQGNNKPAMSEELTDGKNLANFGGTQFRILLPVIKQPKFENEQSIATRLSDILFSKTEVERIEVEKFFPPLVAGNLSEEAKCLRHLFTEIDKLRFKNKDKRLVLLCEFQSKSQISTKVLHYIICELAQRQEILQTCFCTFLDRAIINLLRPNPTLSGNFHRSIVCFDDSFQPYLFGANAADDSYFNEIVTSQGQISEPSKNFAKANPHLFHYSNMLSCYVLSFPGNAIAKNSNSLIQKALSADILNLKFQVFDPSVKVLLLSEAYCQGYFETYKIFSNAQMKQCLLKSIIDNCINNLSFMDCTSFPLGVEYDQAEVRLCDQKVLVRNLNESEGKL